MALSLAIPLSRAAEARLRAPQRRGSFRLLDAARMRMALLSVADDLGQARIFWLVDLKTHIVEDARFLAFGSLASHPLADLFCERVRGQSVEAAAEIAADELEASLRDEPGTAAFGEAGREPLAFLGQLQAKALAALPQLQVPPEPQTPIRYQRKREVDWDDHDRTWLPLTLMRKILKIQQVGSRALHERLGLGEVAWSIEGLHDDFRLVVRFDKGEGAVIPADERPTATLVLQSALRNDIHPALAVEEG